MWFFKAPEIVYGEDALSYLSQLQGQRAFIVTDAVLAKLGYPEMVIAQLKEAGIPAAVFSDVEPEPSLQTVRKGAAAMLEFEPDWIIGLGGGSAMDAAKAMWILYEYPDIEPAAINPIVPIGLRSKARLIAIPTTSGTGSEATWATVLTDVEERRKLGLASREILPDLAIVDPALTANLPPRVTADTGIDVLTHAIEAYTSSWHNDFSDGLALKAIQLVFDYLPTAVSQGARDMEARERMHNAATIAGMAFGNAQAALAHSLGHTLGASFHIPHGRSVGMYLPYTIEYCVRGQDPTRYADLARFLGLPAADEAQGAASLAAAIRDLERRLGLPLSGREMGIEPAQYDSEISRMVLLVQDDTSVTMSARVPNRADTAKLLRYTFDGTPIDF